MKQKPSSRRRRSSNLLKAKRGSEQYQSTNSSASSTTGHGIDSSLDEQVEAGADVWAFLFDQLGLRMDAVKTK
jgi:hypothetical protein